MSFGVLAGTKTPIQLSRNVGMLLLTPSLRTLLLANCEAVTKPA